jgi:hypothetical protein
MKDKKDINDRKDRTEREVFSSLVSFASLMSFMSLFAAQFYHPASRARFLLRSWRSRFTDRRAP